MLINLIKGGGNNINLINKRNINTNVQLRNPYYRKKGFWEWRRRIIHRYNEKRYIRKGIKPKIYNEKEEKIKNRKDDIYWTFKVYQLKISLRNLNNFGRLIKGLHLEDAIIFLESIPQIRINNILNSLLNSKDKIINNFNGDISRLYIDNVQIHYNTPMKYIKYHALGHFGLVKSYRNTFTYTIKQMNIQEFYHKIFIRGNVPRSLSHNMRLYLNQNRINKDNLIEWYPYICGNSRYYFREKLRYLNNIYQFNYYKSRNNWIQNYFRNIDRRKEELQMQRNNVTQMLEK
ncbi:50S ribosomal protein L22, mitochondrial, putative [Plasmodium berghei]|uniref:50S ribosomal protein L22, mitochondrial, putative n=2 Tax=Plasmodium berghei TaxID=5821 RepID=A0A509ANE2_PLABA|nr:50S ribosomal protein L22, mitochondrial, putative [Plasmodium berghei ANKA]CXI74344.1 50S ribosomal protein L22, mitochondrial, putative [Plasmodium berghei]SCM24675.1 50S ribosomal protein L22, mitochondrial, putative [Plasmodium berghei]SCN27136.1 50S ribosomal protein L22, mitochondrial, putative [Plasmodium berghei]SCO61660.1 50S ribosomal protein L22, mitochondrial, putative [Plasmodium berghei]SCO63559.1 50S ribosomal protein L22, mitochondrial, putative [Plasmodium berghei]|eukprot:XP_034422770.1 50S ribosomal protein L22, mitochondrial, putative [Plasmodium berghei ANKA]